MTSGASSWLRALPLGARAGVSALLLVIAGGWMASAAHLVQQHQNRDERPGVSRTDLEGAYHGVQQESSLRQAILRGHPEDLPEAERALLLAWLSGSRVSEDYDSLELGDSAPAELLARRCNACHSRAGLDGEHADARIALSTWEDVARVAFSKRIEPLPTRVLIASTHAHALSLAPLALVICALLAATRFRARWLGPLTALCGVALALDLGGWWLARSVAGLGPWIAVCGGLFAASMALAWILIAIDLWWPPRESRD